MVDRFVLSLLRREQLLVLLYEAEISKAVVGRLFGSRAAAARQQATTASGGAAACESMRRIYRVYIVYIC